MSDSKWRIDAQHTIERATTNLPAEASLPERKKALAAVAWSFHGGTSWGRKIWGQECRKYYERHGQKPRTPKDSPRFANDIIFPFREASA